MCFLMASENHEGGAMVIIALSARDRIMLDMPIFACFIMAGWFHLCPGSPCCAGVL
jgi:hypothetical protein